MTVLPDPPADRSDAVAVELWLAVFDRWFAGMDQALRRDELDAAWRWAGARDRRMVDLCQRRRDA